MFNYSVDSRDINISSTTGDILDFESIYSFEFVKKYLSLELFAAINIVHVISVRNIESEYN